MGNRTVGGSAAQSSYQGRRFQRNLKTALPSSSNSFRFAGSLTSAAHSFQSCGWKEAFSGHPATPGGEN